MGCTMGVSVSEDEHSAGIASVGQVSSRREVAASRAALGEEEATQKLPTALEEGRLADGQRPAPDLFPADRVLLQIYTLAGGKKHVLDAHVNDTIGHVKEMICNDTLQPFEPMLVSESTVLEDDTKVGNLPLQKNEAGEQHGTLTLVNVQLDRKDFRMETKGWCTQGLVQKHWELSYKGKQIWKGSDSWEEWAPRQYEKSVSIDYDSMKLRVTLSEVGQPVKTEVFSLQELVSRANARKDSEHENVASTYARASSL